ncbi:MAG: DNA repair protein RadC [Candidatus Sumerlaeia bacterium]|nr:DNA repair protein RadC [Candidatus Sumerlaeia bacterium]
MKISRNSNLSTQELPREKLLLQGSSRLSNAELLAIILRTGTAEIPATELGKRLLSHFETLENIYAASIKELCEVPGIGKIKAIEIKAALELGKRLTTSEGPNLGVVSSSKDVFHLYQGQLAQKKQEIFLVLLLDTKNRIFKQVEVSLGSLNASLVHPREVFKQAIRESAASVIFVHNHPSGDPKPSHDDISLTHRLYETGEIIGIKVLDHLIIAGNKYFSFADNNLLRDK